MKIKNDSEVKYFVNRMAKDEKLNKYSFWKVLECGPLIII